MTSTDGDSAKLTREEEERLHLQKVTNAFRSHKKHSTAAIHKREEYMGRLPMEQQKLLRKHGYQDTMDDLKLAVEQNNDIIVQILKDVEGLFENVSHPGKAETDPRVRPGSVDMDKVQSTIKQIGRT
jgi:flagellar biosynthesis chaperone FliJ